MKRCDNCGGWADPSEPWCSSCGHGGIVELPSRRTLVLLALGAAACAALIRPLLSPLGPHDYQRAKCGSNLRQIALACQFYADDNEENFPDSLDRLWPNYVSEHEQLSCPRAKDRKGPSYVLIPGLRQDMSGAFILAYESGGANHRTAGRNVAFVDAHVEWLEQDKFSRLLAEQADRLRAAAPGPSRPGLAEGR